MELDQWADRQRIRYGHIPQTGVQVTGIISNETYEWAIKTIQEPTTAEPRLLDHARWIIDHVKAGSLSLPPLFPPNQ